MAWIRFLSLSICFLLNASGASAATLNVVGGQLVGASGVDIGGTLYDVEFVDGSCTALYSGCDSVSDFTFQTQTDATAASQALLDQVFIDAPEGDFDSDSTLTAGCESSTCNVITPYGIDSGAVSISYAANRSVPGAADQTASTGFLDSADSSDYGQWNFALYTSVPEPSTALLLATAFLALAGWRRLPA